MPPCFGEEVLVLRDAVERRRDPDGLLLDLLSPSRAQEMFATDLGDWYFDRTELYAICHEIVRRVFASFTGRQMSDHLVLDFAQRAGSLWSLGVCYGPFCIINPLSVGQSSR